MSSDKGIYLEISSARAFARQKDDVKREYADRAVELMGIGCMRYMKKVIITFSFIMTL